MFELLSDRLGVVAKLRNREASCDFRRRVYVEKA